MKEYYRKFVGILPVLIAFATILVIFNFSTPSRENDVFFWFFKWLSLSTNYYGFIDSLLSLFFGYLSWSIVIYYFGSNNPKRFKRGIKSIILLFPFWLGISIFLSSVGVDSFSNFWLVAHVFLRVWLGGGFIFAIILVLNSVSYHLYKPILKNILHREALKKEKETSIPRSKFIKLIDLLEKKEILILIFLIFLLGLIVSISNFSVHERYYYFKGLVFVFITFLFVTFLFIVNYIFSINQGYNEYIKKREEDFFLYEVENLLKQSTTLIDDGNKLYSLESFKPAIEKWQSAYEIYKKLTKARYEVKKMKENISVVRANLINARKRSALEHNKRAQDAYKDLGLDPVILSILHFSLNEWKSSIEDLKVIRKLTRFRKSTISRSEIKSKIDDIRGNLKRLEIEIMILETDEELKSAHLIQEKEIANTIKLTNKIVISYSNAKKKAEKLKLSKEYAEKIQERLLNVRVFQKKLQEKMDKLIGITPLEKRVEIDMEDFSVFEIATLIKDEIIKQMVSVIREYDFIGGQIRFKLGIVNNTKYPLTNIRITFDLPKALKWILHEPTYDRKGDSILIPKLGGQEKKAVSLYFEPINCMESSINATISFFDAKDKPHAIPMKPKLISISCPIFFTESDANLARVKSLRRNLSHRDKKVFPIVNPEKASSIFSSILSVLEQFDIKLISKEFFEKDNFGEAWFFGITKVKKEQLVMYVLLDGESKTLDFEVSGNNEEQITALLAEIGDRVRQKLIESNIITSEEGFYDMRIAILSCLCPYCYTLISDESVEKFSNGVSTKCDNCDVNIKMN